MSVAEVRVKGAQKVYLTENHLSVVQNRKLLDADT